MYDYCGKHLKPPIQGGSYHHCPICRIVELDKRIAELELELTAERKRSAACVYRLESLESKMLEMATKITCQAWLGDEPPVGISDDAIRAEIWSLEK